MLRVVHSWLVPCRAFRPATGFLRAKSSTSSALAPPVLSKVLVANRGEIACRVIRTCRRFGIPTVAVYSVADGPHSLHAQMADEAHLIGSGPAPNESYLLQDEILRVAQETKAQAIHPGYGFLSENASFAANVHGAGMKFVGPPEAAIIAMGSKSESKAIMDAAGVPTTPGYYETNESVKASAQDADMLLQKAIEIGFPVLIKAVMGGGGKGMRLVWKESEFHEMLEACQRESRAAFGDDRVLLEKYLVRPRHVEVQVVADTHGNVVSLQERDCSLQRRHQKIIEEAPAIDLDPSLRERLGAMGRRAAQAVGYVNAGTVEFLLDTDDEENFYFCEMNTRLQVEHPITEEITGVDLVEWQLRVAAGEPLPITDSSEIPCRGHAFEARIYAENPARDFLPATGNVWHHQPPTMLNTGISDDGIRVDTCIQAGQDISVYYDPMISKLIVHDEDRDAALQKLIKALKGYHIAGLPTNIDFLIKCAQHPTFGMAGAVNTGFLDDHADDVQIIEHATPPPLAQAIGAHVVCLYLENRLGDTSNSEMPQSPWSSRQGSWRIGGESGRARRSLQLERESGGAIECVSNRDGSFDIEIVSDQPGNGESFHVAGGLLTDTAMEVVVNGKQRIKLTAVLKEQHGVIQVRMWPESVEDHAWQVDIQSPWASADGESTVSGSSEGSVKAPMPGKISRLNRKVGDLVKEGEVIMVMEAMKMEHAIKAPRDGTVSEIRHEVNDIVADGALLVVVSNEEEA